MWVFVPLIIKYTELVHVTEISHIDSVHVYVLYGLHNIRNKIILCIERYGCQFEQLLSI